MNVQPTAVMPMPTTTSVTHHHHHHLVAANNNSSSRSTHNSSAAAVGHHNNNRTINTKPPSAKEHQPPFTTHRIVQKCNKPHTLLGKPQQSSHSWTVDMRNPPMLPPLDSKKHDEPRMAATTPTVPSCPSDVSRAADAPQKDESPGDKEGDAVPLPSTCYHRRQLLVLPPPLALPPAVVSVPSSSSQEMQEEQQPPYAHVPPMIAAMSGGTSTTTSLSTGGRPPLSNGFGSPPQHWSAKSGASGRATDDDAVAAPCLKHLILQGMVLVADSFGLSDYVTATASQGSVVPLPILAKLLRHTASVSGWENNEHQDAPRDVGVLSARGIQQRVLSLLGSSADRTFAQMRWVAPSDQIDSSCSAGFPPARPGCRRFAELIAAAQVATTAALTHEQRTLYQHHFLGISVECRASNNESSSRVSSPCVSSPCGSSMSKMIGTMALASSFDLGGDGSSMISPCSGAQQGCQVDGDFFTLSSSSCTSIVNTPLRSTHQEQQHGSFYSGGGGGGGGLTPENPTESQSSSPVYYSKNPSMDSSLTQYPVGLMMNYSQYLPQQLFPDSENCTLPSEQSQYYPNATEEENGDSDRTVGPKFHNRPPTPCAGPPARPRRNSTTNQSSGSGRAAVVVPGPATFVGGNTFSHTTAPTGDHVSQPHHGGVAAGTNSHGRQQEPPLDLCIEVTRQVLNIAPTLKAHVRRDPSVVTIITHRCCRNLCILYERLEAALPRTGCSPKANTRDDATNNHLGFAACGTTSVKVPEGHPYFQLLHTPTISLVLAMVCYTLKEWCQNAFYNKQLNALMIIEGEAAGRRAMESGQAKYEDVSMWKVIKVLYKKHSHRDLRLLTASKLTALEAEILVCLCGAGGACSPTVAEVLLNCCDLESGKLLSGAVLAAQPSLVGGSVVTPHCALPAATPPSFSRLRVMLPALLDEVCRDHQLQGLSASGETATFLAAAVLVAADL